MLIWSQLLCQHTYLNMQSCKQLHLECKYAILYDYGFSFLSQCFRYDINIGTVYIITVKVLPYYYKNIPNNAMWSSHVSHSFTTLWCLKLELTHLTELEHTLCRIGQSKEINAWHMYGSHFQNLLDFYRLQELQTWMMRQWLKPQELIIHKIIIESR